MSLSSFLRRRRRQNLTFRAEFKADGLAVRRRNMDFLGDPAFAAAWEEAVEGNRIGWNDDVPDIRWRAHVACWAARHGLHLDGDFVECGVHTGLLSMTVCHFLDFASKPKRFYLFDTYAGVPTDGLEASARRRAEGYNDSVYFDCYEITRANFAPFPNVELVRGILPDSLAQVQIDKVAYLSVDLNMAAAEKAVIEALWDRLADGAIVLIDDYGFTGYEEQHRVWDDFAAGRDRMVASLPTGQGLLIK